MSVTQYLSNNPELRETGRKLRKVRTNSHWSGLSFEQCDMAERWLFEDNLSHETVAERVKREFGVEVSRWSVGRFFRQRARVRQSMELLEAQVAADEFGMMPVKTEAIRAAIIKLIAKSGMRLATEKPEELMQLLPLVKMLLKGEENEIRLRRVKMEERYYELEANTACAKELEKVRAYLRVVGENDNLSQNDKQARVAALLFGKDKVDVEEAEAAESPEADAESESDALAGGRDPGKGANECGKSAPK